MDIDFSIAQKRGPVIEEEEEQQRPARPVNLLPIPKKPGAALPAAMRPKPQKAAPAPEIDFSIAAKRDPLLDSYQTAQGAKPDEVAEVNRLSRQLQTDPNMVADDLPSARHAANTPDFARIRKETPVLGEMAKDPNFMVVSLDDLGHLSEIEKKVRKEAQRREAMAALEQFVPRFGQTRIGEAVNKYLKPIPGIGAMWDMFETAYDYYRDTETMREFASGQAMARAGLLWNKRRDLVRQGKDLSPEELQTLEMLDKASSFDNNKTGLASFIPAAGEIVGQMVESGISNEKNPYHKGMIAALAAGAATIAYSGGLGAPAAPFTAGSAFAAGVGAGTFERSAAIEGGHAFKEFLQLTHADGTPVTDREALLASDIVGMVNGALELVGFEALLKVVPGLGKVAKGGVRDLATKVPTVKRALLNFAKNYATAWTGEVTTEMLQEFSNIIGSTLLQDQSLREVFSEENMEQIGEIFNKVGKGMAVMGLAGGSVNVAVDIDTAVYAQRRAKALETAAKADREMITAMRNDVSLLRERENESFREFMQRLGDEHHVGEVYINAEALVTALKDTVGDVPAWLEQNNLSPQEVGALIAENGDVALPAGLVAASPDAVFDTLVPSMRLRLDGTAESQVAVEGEALQIQEVRLQEMFDAEQQNIADVNTFREQLAADLTDTGRYTAGQVEVQAVQMTAHIFAMASRAGIPVSEFMQRHMNLRVLRQDGQSMVVSTESDAVYDQTTGKLITDTPAFKKWFGESKVVDEKGQPLVVYHGTDRNFNTFDVNADPKTFEGDRGLFFFTNDSETASGYAVDYMKGGASPGANVMPVYVSLQNPYVVGIEGKRKVDDYFDENDYKIDEARETGSDGLIIENLDTGEKLVVAFDPAQIKSVFNQGTFDGTDPNILNQQDSGPLTVQDPVTTAMDEGSNVTDAEQDLKQGSVVMLRPKGAPALKVNLAASLETVADMVQTGTFHHGMDTVTSASQAAHIMASIRKQTREQFLVLALDADGLPLAIMDVSQGTANASLVTPRDAVGTVLTIPGVKQVWFGHNHPSGDPSPSNADIQVTKQLTDVLKGTGVTVAGHVIVGADGAFMEFTQHSSGTAMAAARTQSVPVFGSPRIRKRGNLGKVSSPKGVAQILTGKPEGVALLDTKNNVVGFVPMSLAEMNELRTGDSTTGSGLLMQAAQSSGAISLIGHAPVQGGSRGTSTAFSNRHIVYAAGNIEAFGNASNLKMLDFIVTSGEHFKSASESGVTGNAPTTFFQDDNPLGSVTFGEAGQVDVKIFEKANLSTFLHESSHIYLESLRTLATEYGVMQQEWQTIKEWLGIGDDNRVTREQHEQFARGGEAYFREGNAPSLGLRKAFAAFKTWLTKLYQSLAQLDVTLTDEVRSVFDKLLATDAEIRQAKEYQGLYALLDREALSQLGLTEAEQTAYLESVGLSDDVAREVIDKHKMLDLHKRRREYRAQALAEWQALPSTLAIKRIIEIGGISRIDLTIMFGEDLVKSLPKNPGLLTNEGLPLAQVLADLETGRDELIEMLTSHQTQGAYVQGVVAAMEAEYDSQIDPADAIHNDRLREQMETESKMLARALQHENVAEARQIKQYAEFRVSTMKPAEINALDRSIVALRKARLAAVAAVRKGDLALALQENEKARMAEAVLSAKIKARDALEVQQRRFNRVIKSVRNNPDKMAAPFRDQLVRLAQRFTLTKNRLPESDSQVTLETFFDTLNTVTQGDELTEMLVGGYGTYGWLYDETTFGTLGEFTYQQITEIADLFKFLYQEGKKAKQNLLSDGRSRDTVVQNLIAKIKGSGIEFKSIREFAPFRNLRKKMRKMGAEQIPLQYIMSRMDLFDTTLMGENAREIFNRLSRAAGEEQIILKDLFDRLQPVIRSLQESAKRHPRVLTGLPMPDQWRIPGKDHSDWTFDKVLAFALNLGNKDNATKLLDGFTLNGETFNMDDALDVTSILSSKDWQNIQSIWDIVDSMWPQLAEVHKRVKHFTPRKVEAAPLDVMGSDGQRVVLKGGYYPIAFDRRDERVDKAADKQSIMESQEAMYPSVKTPQGFTIERKKTAGQRPIDLSLSVLSNHLTNVAHHVTHAEALIDVDMITRAPEYMAAVTKALGAEMAAEIRPALARVANPRADGPALAIDRILEGERNKAAAFILFWNAQVGLKQAFSLANLYQAMYRNKNAGYHMMKAYMQTIRNPLEVLRVVHDLSPNMARRAKGIDRELQSPENLGRVRKLTGKETVEQALEKVSNASGPALIRLMDFIAAYPGWIAAYNQGLRTYQGDQTMAVEYADSLIAGTQPFDRPVDQPKVRASKRSIARMMTMFSGYTMKYANRRSFYWAGWRAGQINHTEFFFHVLAERIAPALAMTALLSFVANGVPDDDDEWKEFGKDMMLDLVLFQFAGRYLIQDLAAGIFTLGRRGILDTPLKEGAELVSRNIGKIYKAFENEEGEAGAIMWALAELLGYQTKLPVTRVIDKAVRGQEQIDEDDGTVVNYLIPTNKR